jgi:hypothetical protein
MAGLQFRAAQGPPGVKPSKTRRSTVAFGGLPPRVRHPAPPAQARRQRPPKAAVRPRLSAPPPPRREVARILDESESTLLDLVDNLLNRGVLLNADVILALAGVDLVYLRLSALLCTADRMLPGDGSR